MNKSRMNNKKKMKAGGILDYFNKPKNSVPEEQKERNSFVPGSVPKDDFKQDENVADVADAEETRETPTLLTKEEKKVKLQECNDEQNQIIKEANDVKNNCKKEYSTGMLGLGFLGLGGGKSNKNKSKKRKNKRKTRKCKKNKKYGSR
jgi:hypothetical protein